MPKHCIVFTYIVLSNSIDIQLVMFMLIIFDID